MSIQEHTPPQALESEQSVLGAMLMSVEAIAEAIEVLHVEDFYRDAHRKIFSAMLYLSAINEPLDLVTVGEKLRQMGYMAEIGGSAYLMALVEACPSSANVAVYARRVAETAQLRRLITFGETVKGAVFSSEDNSEAQIENATAGLLALIRGSADAGFKHISGVSDRVMTEIEARKASPGHVTGLSTGFSDIDALLGGLHRKELFVLAARPRMGKTAMAMQMAWHAASHGNPVAFASLEMSAEALTLRFCQQMTGIDSKRIAAGMLDRHEMDMVRNAQSQLREVPLYVDDARGVNTGQICTRLRRLAMKCNPPSLIIVDFLQKVASITKIENRVRELDSIVIQMRNLSQEFDCPIMCLASLSRGVDSRDDKRPQLADLRESGGIESEADTVGFLYRPIVYARPNDTETSPTHAEFIVGKQRMGAEGIIPLHFTGIAARFDNAAKAQWGGQHYANDL